MIPKYSNLVSGNDLVIVWYDLGSKVKVVVRVRVRVRGCKNILKAMEWPA